MLIVKTDAIKIYLISSREIREILNASGSINSYFSKTFDQVAVDISTSHMVVQGKT